MKEPFPAETIDRQESRPRPWAAFNKGFVHDPGREYFFILREHILSGER
jgi:hypothetical protein